MIAKVDKKACTGCRACELICPVHCITMEEDEEGFLYPEVKNEECVQCGKCLEICTGNKYILKDRSCDRQAYAAWNKSSDIRKNSSSGGIFSELAKYVIKKRGVVYGAGFVDDYSVEQIRIEREEDISLLMGSKYVQSDTKRTYEQALEDLKDGRIVLYSGTPCQIKGLISFVGEYVQNLYCISLVCHGVPSPEIWRRYLSLKRGQYAESMIKNISFRDKTYGWKNFCIEIDFEGRKYLEEYSVDLYMQGFLQNLFLRPSCYRCMAKKLLISDIILGDYWGIEKEFPELYIHDGVSAVVINTGNGKKLWAEISEKVNYLESTYNSVKTYNHAIEESVLPNKNRDKFFEEIKIGGVVEEAIENNLNATVITEEMRFLYQYTILYKYLKRQLSGNDIYITLERMGLKRIILYAITDLLELLLTDIGKKNEEFKLYISDRNFKRYGKKYKEFDVIAPCDIKTMMDQGEFDGVIICNPIRENDIFEELIKEGLALKDIYSLAAIVFD